MVPPILVHDRQGVLVSQRVDNHSIQSTDSILSLEILVRKRRGVDLDNPP